MIWWHVLVKNHAIKKVPVGFADWEIHCSCGKVWMM